LAPLLDALNPAGTDANATGRVARCRDFCSNPSKPAFCPCAFATTQEREPVTWFSLHRDSAAQTFSARSDLAGLDLRWPLSAIPPPHPSRAAVGAGARLAALW